MIYDDMSITLYICITISFSLFYNLTFVVARKYSNLCFKGMNIIYEIKTKCFTSKRQKIKYLDVKLDVNPVVKDKSRLYINELTRLFVEYIT